MSSFPYLKSYNQHKIELRSKSCTFINYDTRYRGYKCLGTKSKVYVICHALFDEFKFTYACIQKNGIINLEPTTSVSSHIPLIHTSP